MGAEAVAGTLMMPFEAFNAALQRHLAARAADMQALLDEAAEEEAAGVRCTGHCCRGFTMSKPLAQLKLEAEYAPLVDDDPGTLRLVRDARFIADMLVPLGLHTENPYHPDLPASEPTELFGCRHLQDNGDCGAYQDRPRMCRVYPVEVCQASACTGPKRQSGPAARLLYLIRGLPLQILSGGTLAPADSAQT